MIIKTDIFLLKNLKKGDLHFSFSNDANNTFNLESQKRITFYW
jgi:hypothetical protein